MLYSVREYACMIGISPRAVLHRIRKNQLPREHAIKRTGKAFVIHVGSIHEHKAQEYFDACVEFQARKTYFERPIELLAELSVKYDVLLTKLCKMLGV